MMKRSLFVFALLMSAAVLPARADDVANRMDQLEQQIRQLVGQVEELNYTVKQLQTQVASAPKQMGAADPAIASVPAELPMKKKLVLQQSVKLPNTISGSGTGVETIESAPLQQAGVDQPTQSGTIVDNADSQVASAAPQAKILGALDNKAAKAGDGGFQGQVIVPLGEGDQSSAAAPDGAAVEPVSLQPETPDDLFLRSEKSLLQLQYSDAESGFKEFLAKYPDHNLAGSAQFKLGETYYAQQQFSEAAQNYMAGYKQFPKSRRAPDSLLKFGLSLNRLGQQAQGCAAIGSVADEFPNAVEVKKRAQTEFRRAGC